MKKSELKQLIKETIQEWKGERFRFWNMTFDVERAQELLKQSPRSLEVFPLRGIINMITKYKNTETGEELFDINDVKTKGWKKFKISFGIINISTINDSGANQSLDKPGIMITLKSGEFLIDGWHRALKRYLAGKTEMQCYILNKEETEIIKNLSKINRHDKIRA